MKRLQDIADQVGVSRTTVSNVLHGNTKKVSKEMIRKISEILNQEGYVPDTSSRELTRKGSCIIGLVLGYNCVHGIPSLRDTFVAELLSGVEETAHRNGYYVMLINGHDQNTDRVAEIASRWNVDGLVVLGLDEKKYKELRRQLNKYMVLIDTYPEAEYHYVNVGTDDFGGGAMIAKYLLDNGYTQAIFAAECDTGADHYRWKGFQHQMRSAGIDCGEERHILLPEDLSLRRVMYGHYLDRFVQAKAVALASDYDAAEVMNYLQDHGIQVPEQVSVTGFDDCIYAELLHPPLTTVRQNVPAKAEAAVELLVRLIRQEPVECKNYVQPVELIRRSSVRESTPTPRPGQKICTKPTNNSCGIYQFRRKRCAKPFSNPLRYCTMSSSKRHAAQPVRTRHIQTGRGFVFCILDGADKKRIPENLTEHRGGFYHEKDFAQIIFEGCHRCLRTHRTDRLRRRR